MSEEEKQAYELLKKALANKPCCDEESEVRSLEKLSLEELKVLQEERLNELMKLMKLNSSNYLLCVNRSILFQNYVIKICIP